jgi:hypothetical protein
VFEIVATGVALFMCRSTSLRQAVRRRTDPATRASRNQPTNQCQLTSNQLREQERNNHLVDRIARFGVALATNNQRVEQLVIDSALQAD